MGWLGVTREGIRNRMAFFLFLYKQDGSSKKPFLVTWAWRQVFLLPRAVPSGNLVLKVPTDSIFCKIFSASHKSFWRPSSRKTIAAHFRTKNVSESREAKIPPSFSSHFSFVSNGIYSSSSPVFRNGSAAAAVARSSCVPAWPSVLGTHAPGGSHTRPNHRTHTHRKQTRCVCLFCVVASCLYRKYFRTSMNSWCPAGPRKTRNPPPPQNTSNVLSPPIRRVCLIKV